MTRKTRESVAFAMTVIGILFTFLGLSLMVGVPFEAHAQTIEAEDVCLARWVWNTDDGVNGEPFWEAPFRANHIGSLDLRTLSQKGPGPIASGWGLFSYGSPMGSTGMHCMGGNLDAPMTGAEAGTLALLLGLNMGDIDSRSMRGIITELLVFHGDPEGVNQWKPIQTTRKGFNIYLGGYGQLYGEQFSLKSQAFQNTIDVRWADYRRRKSQGTRLSVLRAQTGYDGFRIFGREPTPADLNVLLPPEYRADGYSCPGISECTTFFENFNTADSDTLGPVLTWTEVFNDTDIVSNTAHMISSTATARAEIDLAGSDMFAQAATQNNISGTLRGGSACVRFDSTADTAYYARPNLNSGGTVFNVYDLVSRVAGTDTVVSSTGTFTDANGGTVLVAAQGSAFGVFYGGVARASITDTSITGNTRTGLCGRHTGGDRMVFENFFASDASSLRRRTLVIN